MTKKKVEVGKVSVDEAYEYFSDALLAMNLDIEKEFPNFKRNFVFIKGKLGFSKLNRNQMPVVKAEDLDRFKLWMKLTHGVKTTKTKVKPLNLTPIQKQLYLNNPIENIRKHGVKNTLYFLRNKSHALMSRDQYIMDGNHRFLMASLDDPNKPIQTYKVDMNMEELITQMNHFTDNIVKKARNESEECYDSSTESI